MQLNESESSIFEKVRAIVVEQLDVDSTKVTLDANFTELGADSLDTVELVMAIEEEFNIEIPDKDAEEISNLQQAVDFIQNSMDRDIK
uniref:Acyl carrier protein n=1 Tax=Centroceras clavulatum TaxID=159503 RepID=A0A4D6WN77_9FLOR|nr:Acyl carrier protein [Centroceras clavulatum]